jgi:hypothetical protein
METVQAPTWRRPEWPSASSHLNRESHFSYAAANRLSLPDAYDFTLHPAGSIL